MEQNVDRILDAKVLDSQRVSLSFGVGSDVINLQFDVRLANELADTLSALSDEVMRRSAPQSSGMKAGAFRKCQNAIVNIDATLSVLLLEFDPGERHRVGVALPIDRVPPLVRQMEQHTKKARKLGRTQRRQ